MRPDNSPFRILFVCTGNICRSPLAEGVLTTMAAACNLGKRIEAKSAGTIAYHAGEAPDERSIDVARARGIDISAQRARQIEEADFYAFDMIVALDRSHLQKLFSLRPDAATAELALLMEFAPQTSEQDVQDPYYGGLDDFQAALDLIEAGCAGLLDDIRRGFQDAARGLRGSGAAPLA